MKTVCLVAAYMILVARTRDFPVEYDLKKFRLKVIWGYLVILLQEYLKLEKNTVLYCTLSKTKHLRCMQPRCDYKLRLSAGLGQGLSGIAFAYGADWSHPSERAHVYGMLSATYQLTFTCSPYIGAVIYEHAAWQPTIWVLCVGLFAGMAAYSQLPRDRLTSDVKRLGFTMAFVLDQTPPCLSHTPVGIAYTLLALPESLDLKPRAQKPVLNDVCAIATFWERY